MIRCSNCGCENSNYSIYCKECRAILSSAEETPSGETSAEQRRSEEHLQEPDNAGFQYLPPEKDRKGSYTFDPTSPAARQKFKDTNDPFCLWGFVLTAVSFISCGYLAPVSLILSIIGLVRVSSSEELEGKSIAIVGIVASSILLGYRVFCIFN